MPEHGEDGMAQSVPGTGSTEKSSRCHVPSLPFDWSVYMDFADAHGWRGK